MSKIKEIQAREIKDSNNKPTVEVELITEKGSFTASCPSGASTGKNEALELRDSDGLGVQSAIKNVNEIIAPKLKGKDCTKQKELDELMLALDGTENKSVLGANAILPVSMALCRAGATAKKLPLYAYIAELAQNRTPFKIPLAMFNILEGGAHANNDLDIQEFMVVPQKKLFSENLMLCNRIFNELKRTIIKNYGETTDSMAEGKEGGFAPQISKTEQALYLLKNAIEESKEGDYVKITMDCAASEFFKDGKYVLEKREFSRQALVDFYADLTARFPIISIEDPFAEEDFEGFKELTAAVGPKNVVVVGDDLTCTNIRRIKMAEAHKACSGIIIKVNQIGSVSETLEAVTMAQSFGWSIIVSHRSGETMDTFIADLSVGTGAQFIKSGSPAREERMVKYNRLLEIESELKTI